MSRGSGVEPPNGFAIIDKESGWTSHDVVARARKLLNTRKVGHSGTLDPSATGVLILGVGRGTRLLRFITELPKTYVTTFRLGSETSTLDADGETTATYDMSGIDLADVRRVAERFIGNIEQIPPMVSAVKVDGRRLHELAREGKVVERKPRPVTIHELSVDGTDTEGDFVLTVRCSSGTYVRTLAADIGIELGGGAHVRVLRRTVIGDFDESVARPLEQVALIDLAEGLRGRPTVSVSGDALAGVRVGKVFERDALGVAGDGPWVVLDTAGDLVAVYQPHKDTSIKPAVVVAPASG